MINKLLKHHLLVLASGSPRRRELFKMLGLDFTVRAAQVAEPLLKSAPFVQAEHNAKNKAFATAEDSTQDEIIVAADTIVILAGKILGKPHDQVQAAQYLSMLSGNTHEVITGICVLYKGEYRLAHEVSKVRFAPLSASEIADYVNTSEPLDKAGAYGIQGYGSQFIEHIDGCYFNIMGFPIHRFYEMLKTMQKEGLL